MSVRLDFFNTLFTEYQLLTFFIELQCYPHRFVGVSLELD